MAPFTNMARILDICVRQTGAKVWFVGVFLVFCADSAHGLVDCEVVLP